MPRIGRYGPTCLYANRVQYLGNGNFIFHRADLIGTAPMTSIESNKINLALATTTADVVKFMGVPRQNPSPTRRYPYDHG